MTRGSTILWGKDELTRAPAPDAKHIRRGINSASKREGFHTSTNPFASVSAMVTRRRKTSQSLSHRGAAHLPAPTTRLHGVRGDTDHASLPDRPLLVQFAIDVVAVLFAFLFVAVTGIGLGFAVFSILFLSF